MYELFFKEDAMLRKFLVFVALIAVAVFFTGCATILSGDNQKINLRVKDSTKTYTGMIDGQAVKIPSIVEIKRENKDKMLTINECPSEQVLLRKEVNPVFFVNILSGGVFGSTTDYASDSMWKYQPEDIVIDCK
jgi:hypothetical protein